MYANIKHLIHITIFHLYYTTYYPKSQDSNSINFHNTALVSLNAFSTTCSLIPKNSAISSKPAFSFSVVMYAYTSFASEDSPLYRSSKINFLGMLKYSLFHPSFFIHFTSYIPSNGVSLIYSLSLFLQAPWKNILPERLAEHFSAGLFLQGVTSRFRIPKTKIPTPSILVGFLI